MSTQHKNIIIHLNTMFPLFANHLNRGKRPINIILHQTEAKGKTGDITYAGGNLLKSSNLNYTVVPVTTHLKIKTFNNLTDTRAVLKKSPI